MVKCMQGRGTAHSSHITRVPINRPSINIQQSLATTCALQGATLSLPLLFQKLTTSHQPQFQSYIHKFLHGCLITRRQCKVPNTCYEQEHIIYVLFYQGNHLQFVRTHRCNIIHNYASYFNANSRVLCTHFVIFARFKACLQQVLNRIPQPIYIKLTRQLHRFAHSGLYCADGDIEVEQGIALRVHDMCLCIQYMTVVSKLQLPPYTIQANQQTDSLRSLLMQTHINGLLSQGPDNGLSKSVRLVPSTILQTADLIQTNVCADVCRVFTALQNCCNGRYWPLLCLCLLARTRIILLFCQRHLATISTSLILFFIVFPNIIILVQSPQVPRYKKQASLIQIYQAINVRRMKLAVYLHMEVCWRSHVDRDVTLLATPASSSQHPHHLLISYNASLDFLVC